MSAEFKVGDWLVYPTENLIRDGQETRSIEPKAMDLLVVLAKAKGELVTRDSLMNVLWSGRYVTDYALNNLVASLRRHLHKNDNTHYITTRPKSGYQLAVAVVELGQLASTPATALPQTIVISDKKAQDLTEPESTTNLPLSVQQPAKTWLQKSTRGGLGIAVLLLVGLLTVWQVNRPIDTQPSLSPSIAVLPFDVFNGQDAIDYFADGLAEEIIHQLTVIPDLKVISRTSSFAFRDSATDIKEIARKLDVSYVLEGSVREEQGTMRVTLQLINGVDGSHIWSKVFSANSTNAFNVQEQISTVVADSIDRNFTRIPAGKVRFHPQSGDAYLHMLKGRKLNGLGTADAYRQALEEFTMAVHLQPDYAIVYADIALNYLLLYQYRKVSLEDASQHAKEAIDQALALEPELAEAYAVKGVYHSNLAEYDAAKLAFEQALAINPDLYIAQLNYGYMLYTSNKKREALPYYQHAKSIHPLSASANWGIGIILVALGEFDQAWAQYKNCVDLLPNYTSCKMGLAYVNRLTNQNLQADETLLALQQQIDENDYYMRMAQGFHLLWTNRITDADSLYTNLLRQYGFNIEALQSISLLKWRLGYTEQWMAELASAKTELPNNSAVAINYAMNAYRAGDCELALGQYETVFNQHPELHADFDGMANSVSYLADMAYCYGVTENKAARAATLKQLQETLADFPNNQHPAPGVMYVRAKYFALSGEAATANEILATLRAMPWPLAWLIDDDPLLKALL
jgi:TolB-like protein/DNA-binding winged helix-turn-helix (wHTH) protein/tetratricopeptide (TPR) repeat protein